MELKFKSCIGIVILTLMQTAFGLQRFSEQPVYTEVNPNQDALLVCKVSSRRGACSWQKDSKPVGLYPKKYEWASGSTSLMGMQASSGDCSIWIRGATLEFDDGIWECQVTASDFTSQDALTSQPVRLVVRVAPQKPKIEYEGQPILPSNNITVDSGASATVKCISHYGNPPAVLKWYLGDQEIAPLHKQTNASESDNPRTWSATSVVQIPATKERHGLILKCLAIHEYYASRTVSVEARLDVRYAPTVKLLGSPQIDLEEGKDSIVLRCEADANPPASIVWRRAGRSEIASLTESLQLRPVGRRDSGLYTCQAQNSVGTSDQLSLQLDIKYPPRVISAGPDRLVTAPLFTAANFECIAEGNPPPMYKWVQRIPSQGNVWLERGRESRLLVGNVTYDYQGEYECRAINFINGQERSTTSDPISLQVVGAPQVLHPNHSAYHVQVKRGESASLTLVVCADPRPRHVAWEWGSLRLEAGASIGRFRVDDVTTDQREDCYIATLHINQADVQDSRSYYLVVENERGADRHSIVLKVEGLADSLEMGYVLGIGGVFLAMLLISLCFCIYAFRAKKFCFKNQNNYKTADSEIADHDIGVPIFTTPITGYRYPPHDNSHEIMQQQQTSATHYATLFQPQHDANLVLSAIRHQRDLFSGGQSSTLGIPEVHGHVGSVIHAFENLAYQRQLRETGEKPYESSSSDKKESVYRIILPPPPQPNQARPQKRQAPEVPPKIVSTIRAQTPEAQAEDSFNDIEEERHRKFPQSYVKNYKVLPPFNPRSQQPSRIPTKANSKSKLPTGVYLKPTHYSEDDVENDFLRGSTVSQSFIQKKSTYEQNLLHDGLESNVEKKNRQRARSRDRDHQKFESTVPLMDEVAMRYKEYKSKNPQPRSTIDRAEL